MKKEKEKTIKSNVLMALLDRNTQEINRRLVISMAFCFLCVPILLVLSEVFNVFSFSKELKLIIGVIGTVCTLSPYILYRLKASDAFLKIYILLAMQIMITAMGTNNGIGIYITYVLVPLASCAYLNRKFSRMVTIISYFFMVTGVYFNAAGKLEVEYLGWSHFTSFRNYIIGFTIEYIIVYLFMEVILQKAEQIVNEQQRLLTDLQSERESYELLLEGTDDILFKYIYENDSFQASDSILDRKVGEKCPILISKFTDTKELPSEIYNLIHKYATERNVLQETVLRIDNDSDSGRDRTDEARNNAYYFEIEGRVIYDTKGQAASFVGMIRDITARMREEKRKELEKETDKLTGMYYYSHLKKYIATLPECYQEGMMLSITILNFDSIVETYGFIYGDAILKKIKRLLYEKAERGEFCCRMHGAQFLYYTPSLEYVDGFLLQQDMLKALATIYVGEKEPNSLKCDIVYGQVNLANIDEFTNVNKLDFKRSIKHKRNRSLFDLLKLNEKDMTGEEQDRMNECQAFTNSVSELLRGAKDAESTIRAVFFMMSDFFGFDRIIVLEGEMTTGQADIIYEWTSKPEYELGDYFGTISEQQIEDTKRLYTENGYIALYKDDIAGSSLNSSNDEVREFHEKVAINVLLGAQLWIPTTLSEEQYTGAWHFDRCNAEHYSPIDIFWVAETVNVIMNYIRRMRADSANQAKTNFLSIFSHEIRTPMNAIIGLSEISLREEMPPELRYNVESIHSAGVGLLGLINDVLDISKIESGKMEIIEAPYDTLSVLNDLCVMMRARNKDKGLELIFDISENIPSSLCGDMVRVKQIITNLAGNAIKYTETGSVKLTVESCMVTDDIVDLVAIVEDTGIGIRQEDMGKLFKKYGQVDTVKNHTVEGTGLGLAICKQLADLMQGTIEVESEYGKGSVFKVVIPQKVVDAKPAGSLNDYKGTNSGTADIDFIAPSAKILVADDTEMNLTVFKGLAAPLKMQIDTAENGKIATELAANKEYDIIFMDHMMPVMDGVEATRVIRKNEGTERHTPIISVSANATLEAKNLFAKEGMDGFVSKPIRMKELLSTLKKHLPADKIIKSDVDEKEEAEIKFEPFAFDYWKGVEWCGSPEMLDGLLGDYYAMVDTKADLIENHYEEGRLHEFVIEVHSLKSSSRMIGAEGMSKRFETLEMLGTGGALETIDKLLGPTLEMYRGAKTVLKNYAKVKVRKTLCVDSTGKKDALEMLIAAMEEFDTDKADCLMKSISQYDFSDSQLKLVEKLEAYVADLDVDNSIKISHELMESLEAL